MSIPAPKDATPIPGTVLPSAINLPAVNVPHEKGTHFVLHREPDEIHQRLLLEGLEQLFSSGGQALYLDPSSENYRLSLAHANGLSELGVVPLAIGRCIVEVVKRNASLLLIAENPLTGKFQEGVLRVDHRGAEKRLQVYLIPTAFGPSASLRAVPSLPAGSADLIGLGFAPDQEQQVSGLVSKGAGVILVGGPDPEAISTTAATMVARAVTSGRRAAVVAVGTGADTAGVARIETPPEDAEQARAITKLAESGVGCIMVEHFIGGEAARAAALAALHGKSVIIAPVVARSAVDAIGQFMSLGVRGVLASTVGLATCQIQLPLLCPACARWGESNRDDMKFLGLNIAEKVNYYVRAGCQRCNSEVVEVAQIFELLAPTDAARNNFRAELPFENMQSELQTTPGYMPFLKIVAAALKEGRCSLSEARQYISWQLPAASK